MKSILLLWGQRLIERRNAWFLAPLSWIWGFYSFLKNTLYDWKILPIERVPATVVSVGNLVAGGTGKTPLVLLLAETFCDRNVAILSRGYGKIPDEPLLLQRRLPKAKVYIGKDRVASARKAIEEGAELLLLDDGFQHRKLGRDFDLVILDGKDPFGKGHYLPWGFLRDSPKRLKEADALFIRGKNALFPHAIQIELQVKRILDQKEHLVSSLERTSIGYFCGIAKPEGFKKTLLDLGARICSEWILADHEPIKKEQLMAFASRCKSLNAKAVVCTEKDFIKLPKNLDLDLPLLFVEMELKIANGLKEWEMLVEKIGQRIDNTYA